jgi:predicted amidohydrolase
LYGLEGIDILVAPIGGLVYELRNAWHNILWTRAIENLCYVMTCQNLYGMEDGLGLIASPEEILVESKKPGLIFADCDLDRIKWLRSQTQSLGLPKPYKVIPGLLKYRRPEFYTNLSKASQDLYDFYYYKKNIKI